MSVRKLADHEFQTNWQIAFRMDHNHEVKIISKKHPKYKQIVKVINVLIENGIQQRAEDLGEYGVIMLYYSFEKLLNLKVFNQIKYELNKKRSQITLNQLSSLFGLLFAAFPFLFVIFIIESIYYKFSRNLSWI